MLLLVRHLGSAIACSTMLYFWLVWMFEPEGPVHHVWAISRAQNNREAIAEIKESIDLVNPLPRIFSYEVEPGVFSGESNDVENTSAEDSRTESATESAESDQETGRITTLGRSDAELGDRPRRDEGTEGAEQRRLTSF